MHRAREMFVTFAAFVIAVVTGCQSEVREPAKPSHLEELERKGHQLWVDGNYEDARQVLEELLSTYRRLFSADKFPDGHPKIASTLTALGVVLGEQGKFDAAISFQTESVAMYRRLYPAHRSPRGHPDLWRALISLGGLRRDEGDIDAARRLFEETLAMARHLYPEEDFPKGHPDVATSLARLGNVLGSQQSLDRALALTEQALAIRRSQYPESEYPNGNREMAEIYYAMGLVLRLRGENEKAKYSYRRSVEIYSYVYPEDSFPNGHPELARSLGDLGSLYWQTGDIANAQELLERVVRMFKAIYPTATYPKGHPSIAIALQQLGNALHEAGDIDRAEECLAGALAMNFALYPPDAYPNGHPSWFVDITSLAVVYLEQGKLDMARQFSAYAALTAVRLYPTDVYPHGHDKLAVAIENLAAVLWRSGDAYGATRNYETACKMRLAQAEEFCGIASEAESLNFLARVPRIRDFLISLRCIEGGSIDTLYPFVWRSRSLVSEAATEVRQARLNPSESPAPDSYPEYLGVRRSLARLAMAPAEVAPDRVTARRRSILELIAKKEQLEKAIASTVRDLNGTRHVARRPHTELISRLGIGMAFVDVVRFHLVDFGPTVGKVAKGNATPSYVAFILTSDQPVRMVELGAADSIDAAVRSWREEIAGDRETQGARELRRLVWEPIEATLPAGTDTLYLTPDGPLTSVPWAALPGRAAGTVLLEDYAVALVPYGPFLLDKLLAGTQPKMSQRGRLLAVGGVAYDDEPAAVAEAPQIAGLRSAAEGDGPRVRWPKLPSTLDELRDLEIAASDLDIVPLKGRDASTARVFAELPHACWAVFATHGFFADSKLRSALQLDPELFERRDFLLPGERTTPVGRNPLVLSGLVFAGANLLRADDERGIPQGDGGILTAEAIAALPLGKLELAVLSACDTGLGEVAGGEGVFGLQRAFHLAGCSNVVASLWKVDDRATAALMRLFYHKLWREHKPPLAALREAQLAIYRNPDQIVSLATSRGPDFTKAVELVDGGKVVGNSGRASTRLWAAFVLSGAGVLDRQP